MPPTPAKTLTALRQLALLGHNGTLAIQEAMTLLHGVVGFEAMSFVWINAQCELVDAVQHEQVSVGVLLDYQENFQNRLGGEDISGYNARTALASNAKILPSPCRETVTKAYINSEFYNRISAPSGYGLRRIMPIRHANGAPLGCLNIGRSLKAPDFSPTDLHGLELAQPWLEHLLRRGNIPDNNVPFVSTGESAVLILDFQGKVLSASSKALTMLHQVADVSQAGDLLRNTTQGDVRALLKRIVRPMAAALHGIPVSLPPEACIINRWGRFYLRAYMLTAFEEGSPQQISLHIERHAPMSLRLFRCPRFLALSPREREVCLHLLADRSHAEIAASMHVKLSTVVYFIRQIYRRLDINRQEDLWPALLLEKKAALRP